MKRGLDYELIFLTVLLTVVLTRAVEGLWSRMAHK
jgi:hypothetical protein